MFLDDMHMYPSVSLLLVWGLLYIAISQLLWMHAAKQLHSTGVEEGAK